MHNPRYADRMLDEVNTSWIFKALRLTYRSGKRHAAAAAPQVIGLITQFIIIKILFYDAAAKSLSAYQFALTVSSILYLGLAYQQNTIKLDNILLGLIQAICLGVGATALLAYRDLYIVSLALFIAYFLSISLIQYVILQYTDERRIIIAFSIISIISPQILWISPIWALVLTVMLFGIFVFLNRSVREKTQQSHDYNQSAIISLIYNIALQAPLLMLPLFDPFLASVVGAQFYVNFVLFQKFTNGIGVLSFSRIQMKILLRQYRMRHYFVYLSIFCVIGAASVVGHSIWGASALVLQCVLLSLNINVSSVVIRDHLQWGRRSYFLLMIAVAAVFTYGSVVYFYFRMGWVFDDVVTLMILATTFPTLLVLLDSYMQERSRRAG